VKLTAQQRAAFDEQGYLFLPSCFSEDEIALLRAEADVILKSDRQEVWREKTGAPRTAFAAHTFSTVFHLLACHPRLVEPLQHISASRFMFINSSSTPRRHLKGTSGNGIRITEHGRATTECRNPVP